MIRLILIHYINITVVLTICKKLTKMKDYKKEWFCFQCSLQFDSSSVFHLHLKLLHKESIKVKVEGNKPNSNESIDAITAALEATRAYGIHSAQTTLAWKDFEDIVSGDIVDLTP